MACSQAWPDLAEGYPEVMSWGNLESCKIPRQKAADDVIECNPDVTSASVAYIFRKE